MFGLMKKRGPLSGYDRETLSDYISGDDHSIARESSPQAAVEASLPSRESLLEYRETCAALGFVPPMLIAEELRLFLAESDLPIFNLKEVVAYMDNDASKSPAGMGWMWRPLREKDIIPDIIFGRPFGPGGFRTEGPASDYYCGREGSDQHGPVIHFGPRPYAHEIPLHALKKVSTIEQGFKGASLRFFVSDYVGTEDFKFVNPDPFLMVAVPGCELGQGKGRFIIDVWDEPGFGLEQMLK